MTKGLLDRRLQTLHDLLWHLGGEKAAALAPEWLAALDAVRSNCNLPANRPEPTETPCSNFSPN